MRSENRALSSLLDHLAQPDPPAGGEWQGWAIARITGGANSLLFRATGPLGDLAVKFTPRDERRRAVREYGALLALERAGLDVAPRPVLLDWDREPHPVVVQSWLEGQVCADPPATDAEWEQLLRLYAAIHTLTPARTEVPLAGAVINAAGPAACREIVQRQVACLPPEARPAPLASLLRRWEAAPLPDWPTPPPALCRVDANTLNLIRRPGAWASVDWESSGWGDPAFEIGELMAHPAYVGVPAGRWAWVSARYTDLVGDPSAAERIRTYYRTMLVFFVVRLARYLYEVPRGLDPRLATRPAGWQADVEAKYAHYLALAEELIER